MSDYDSPFAGCVPGSTFNVKIVNEELTRALQERFGPVPKSRPDLFPPDALALAGEVLAFGLQKHPSEPWKRMTVAEHVAACWRHMLEWQAGRKVDVESGKDHLTHALCRLAMAVAVNASREQSEDAQ